jgi:hypothetical protein
MNITSHLSVSSKRLKNCDTIIKRLHELKIMSSIKNNNSVICDNNNCWLEYGCDITLTDFNPKLIKEKVWKPLSKEFGFNCAYLNVEDKYKGCIHDFKTRNYHK